MNGMWQSHAAWLPKLGLKVTRQQPGACRTLALGAQPPGEATCVCWPTALLGPGTSPSHLQRWREGGSRRVPAAATGELPVREPTRGSLEW